MHEADGDDVQEVELLASAALGDDEARVLEHAEMLHHAEARHRRPPLELAERLPVALLELVEEAAARGIREGFEDVIHAGL